jgi:hypothetical protein
VQSAHNLFLSVKLDALMLRTSLCRDLTYVKAFSDHMAALPLLPAHLEQLSIICCRQLHMLPALPPTLRKLLCDRCDALEELPSSFSSTAVSELSCISFSQLKSLPQLPLCLGELILSKCSSLVRLPELPETLRRLEVPFCEALTEVNGSAL